MTLQKSKAVRQRQMTKCFNIYKHNSVVFFIKWLALINTPTLKSTWDIQSTLAANNFPITRSKGTFSY